MSPKFILGLIAGEGSFNVALHHQPEKSAHGVRPRPQMCVTLHERDRDIVEKCAEETGLGTFHVNSTGATWAVSSKGECQELVRFVEENAGDGFKCTEKWDAFQKWKVAVEIVGDPYESCDRDEVLECIELARSMNQAEKANTKSEEEWKEMVK